MPGQPIPLASSPGIKRDGTQFDCDNYREGLWCRFERGLPRKMGGYRAVTSDLPQPVYGMHVFSQGGQQYAHLGSQSLLTQVNMDSLGNLNTMTARTPAGLAVSINNLWQFGIMFDDVGSNINFLIAHAGQNLADITSSVETPIYVGDVTAVSALTASAMGSQSGGLVVLDPYLLTFGNSGKVEISAAGNPAGAATNTAYITGSKIVAGMPLRGSGQGPSGLLWSLDSIIRATFIGGSALFAFDTLSAQSSILSSQSVIEYDGIFYWVGVDRFLRFTGVVDEVENTFNKDWFFKNLNKTQRQKVIAFKIPRYGEIWWCFPFGNATECTHAVIYNVNQSIWYDTELPTQMRTAAYFPQTYDRPYLTDALDSGSSGYTLWQHETGTDAINGFSIQPIRSYFKTGDISFLKFSPMKDQSLAVAIIEPDFVQTGDLTLTVHGRANARSPEINSEEFNISEPPATSSDDQVVRTREVRRLMSFKIESNQTGGDYEMGRPMIHITEADSRITQ